LLIQLEGISEAETAYIDALKVMPHTEGDHTRYREIQQALADFLIGLGFLTTAK